MRRLVWSEKARRLRRAVPLVALVGAALPVPAVWAARPTPFRGSTSQPAGPYGSQQLPSNRITFSVGHDTVRSFSIPWVAPCRSSAGGGRTDAILGRTLVVSAIPVTHGRFSGHADYNFSPGPHQTAEVAFMLRGKIQGRRAGGSLSIGALVSVDSGPTVADCQTPRPIRWTARRGSGTVDLAAPALVRPRPAAPGLIAYARTGPGGASAIWQSNSNGTGTQRLTKPRAGVSDTSPSPIPVGTGFAFERAVAGVSQIYISGEGLPHPTRFPGGRDTAVPRGAHDPAMSPLANRIAFSVGTGSDCSLWLMDVTGAGQRRLTDHGVGPGCDRAPAWSADGKYIAFERTTTDALGSALGRADLVVAAAGGTPRPLGFLASPGAFSWAPGRKLVFVAPLGSSQLPSLQIINADGSGRRMVLSSTELTGRPGWSPDENAIVFVRRQPDGSTDLATVSAPGGIAVEITNTPGISESQPAWSYPALVKPSTPSTINARPVRPHRHRRRSA